MSIATEPQHEARQPIEAFNELRAWIDDQMIEKGLRPGSFDRVRSDFQTITTSHIDQLKTDLITLIKSESRRSFWSGLAVNAIFFVLGVAAGLVADMAKARGLWPI